MKPGGSGLNPNAAAYVPLSKREGDSAKPVAAVTTTHHMQHHQPYGYGVQGKGSSPGSHMRNDDLEIDMEMEMEFLLATFSGLSDESIRDVYLANNGDLDATIEMINDLGIYSNEAEEYLPDTLDIGDVPETIEPSTSPKQKSASNEASASTSSVTPLTTLLYPPPDLFDESLKCEVLKFLDMVFLGEISFYIVHNAFVSLWKERVQCIDYDFQFGCGGFGQKL